MLAFQSREKYGVYDLQKLVSLLRSEGGCPWDREQTHESIRRNLIEEAYEAAEAIDTRDYAHLREELGDVLTQVVFHADIEADAGRFDLDGVADATVKKLLYRHPHVFGDTRADTAGEVLANWDELKRREKSQDTLEDTLRGIARSLPALWRADKVLEKAAKSGCGAADAAATIGALRAAVEELESGGADKLGGVLLAAVAAARAMGIDPEDALGRATNDFIDGAARAESIFKGGGKLS